MSDNVTAPEQEQQSSTGVDPSTIDISQMPDQLPTEDVKGLKSAFEKLKALLYDIY